MMLYSQWNPTDGLYDYFEGGTAHGLNDDLPKPQMPKPSSALGVAAIECGRPLPPGARHVGRGKAARGLIALPSTVAVHGQRLAGAPSDYVRHVGTGVILGFVATYLALRWWKK